MHLLVRKSLGHHRKSKNVITIPISITTRKILNSMTHLLSFKDTRCPHEEAMINMVATQVLRSRTNSLEIQTLVRKRLGSIKVLAEGLL